jgi:hypothetical protein
MLFQLFRLRLRRIVEAATGLWPFLKCLNNLFEVNCITAAREVGIEISIDNLHCDESLQIFEHTNT